MSDPIAELGKLLEGCGLTLTLRRKGIGAEDWYGKCCDLYRRGHRGGCPGLQRDLSSLAPLWSNIARAAELTIVFECAIQVGAAVALDPYNHARYWEPGCGRDIGEELP